jgi:hypothetical protein
MNYQRKFNTGTRMVLCLLSLFMLLFNSCKKDEKETVKVPLAVTDYYPNSGNQGTLVTIEGTGFSTSIKDISATFGDVNADVVSATATAVVLRAPATGITGSIAMKMNGQTLTIGNYTYQELSVQGISPVNGAAGTHIRITGAGFSSTKGPAEVFINGKPALVVSASDNVLVAEVPESAGTGPVTIKVNGKEANGQIFKFQVISGIKPASGGKGTNVKISGGGFDDVKAGNLVDFNGKAALVTEATADYLVVTAPDGVQTGPVSVTINNQKATGPIFTVVPMPKIDAVTPLSGPAGTVMTITGSNFSTFTDENKVTINGKLAVALTATAFKITLTIPGSTGNGKVVLNVNDQVVQGPDFKDQTLGIASLSPDNGLAGTQVTITGTGFNTSAALNTVTFNGVNAHIKSATATSLVVVTPPTLTSGVVSVTTGGQTASSPTNFNRAGVMTLAGGPNSLDLNITSRGASITVDSHGNVFLLDFTSQCIRKITPQGVVSVFAGSDSKQSGNQNGTGTSALFSLGFNGGMVVDKQDNLYISDAGNSSIRKITPGAVVSTYAVNLVVPGKMAIDDNGILYVQTQYSLTRVDKSGVRSAMKNFFGGNDSAQPAIIGSYLYYTDNDNLYISRYDLVANINTRNWAGNGGYGYADGPKDQAMLLSRGLLADGQGNLFFSDGYIQTTRKINMTLNEISTISRQSAAGYKDGGLDEAQFRVRLDMAIDKDGNIYIVDQYNNAIRKMFLK